MERVKCMGGKGKVMVRWWMVLGIWEKKYRERWKGGEGKEVDGGYREGWGGEGKAEKSGKET